MFPGYPHPTGQTNPATFRANAALPAAGAWDATPLEITTIQYGKLTLYFEYDEDSVLAGDGAFDFYLEYSPYSADLAGVEDWFRMSIYDPGVLVAGADVTSNIQREIITYSSTAAAVETFVFGPIEISKTVERMRLVARESGEIANPGDLLVVGVLNFE